MLPLLQLMMMVESPMTSQLVPLCGNCRDILDAVLQCVEHHSLDFFCLVCVTAGA